MEFWGVSDKGKVRPKNQDVFDVLHSDNEQFSIFVVCDGMGGAKSGHIASRVAADTFMQVMGGYIDSESDTPELAGRTIRAVIEANRAVHEKSMSDPDCQGMGTTLVAAVLSDGGGIIANVGDSRAYHVSEKGVIQISKDHSVVEDLIDRGDITRIEAKNHPNKNLITRALGSAKNEMPDLFEVEFMPGDVILLCSDGLSNLVGEHEMLYELMRADSLEESGKRMLELALERGAPDNVTVLLVKNTDKSPAE